MGNMSARFPRSVMHEDSGIKPDDIVVELVISFHQAA